MPKVLTVVDSLGPGGTQRVAAAYAGLYAASGFDSGLLALSAGGSREAAACEAGVSLFVQGDGFRPQEEALQTALKWGPDIVHIHREGYTDPRTGRVLLAFQAAGAKIIETNVFARVDYSPARKAIWAHMLLSKWCLWKWRKWARGLDPQPLGTIVPNVVESARFFPEPEAGATFRAVHGVSPTALVTGRVGQAIEGKWAPIMVDAFEGMARSRPDLYLILVGAPPSIKKRVAKMPQDLQARARLIDFLGTDADLRACYSAMDVFLHAARIGESFGLVLGEAMLCGLPVVTWSRPLKDNSQLEVVGHGRGGFVVNDLAGMVDALKRLLEDVALRKEMAMAGAAWTRTHYDAPIVRKKLSGLVELLMHSESRSEFRIALSQDKTFEAETPDLWVKELLNCSMGHAPRWQAAAMRLVHKPSLYRAYLRLRGRAV